MRFFLEISLIAILHCCFLSCNCENPKVTHIDFCDFLNELPSGSIVNEGAKEKSIHFILESGDTKCLKDSFFIDFLRKSELVQKEIHAGYYRLNIVFYKKSNNTDELIKLHSNKYLDYCQKDIIVEYQWFKGLPTGQPLFYENGIIKDAENIKLDSIK